mgnify:CR=1 FL=1
MNMVSFSVPDHLFAGLGFKFGQSFTIGYKRS